LVKIFRRRDCGIGIGLRDVLDYRCHVADLLRPSRGREEQSVVLALVVALFVIMLLALGERFPQGTFPRTRSDGTGTPL
jgi:hypothetical protein